LPRRYSSDFFDYIGKCPVECYSYKWPTVLPKQRRKIVSINKENNIVDFECGHKVIIPERNIRTKNGEMICPECSGHWRKGNQKIV
jgi:acetone carboxylase gamma subunit